MRYFRRTLENEITRAAKGFPATLLTGPRRYGKTTLLSHLYPEHECVLLEDLDVLARAGADPRAFLDALSLPVILDEIQNLPGLFPYNQLRSMLTGYDELKRKIEAMERKYDENFQVVFEAIKQLLEVEKNPNRQIGFVNEKIEKRKSKGIKARR